MSSIPGLMEQGKHEETEAALDKALEILGVGIPGGEEKENREEASLHRERPERFGTPDELEAEVSSLREQKVAWRKIEWKTCLLDGLAASRAEAKPMLFWCHIDLPADDKRC